MIDIRIPSRRAPPPAPSYATYTASHESVMFKEIKKKDEIIRELAASVKYAEGEIVTPFDEEMRKKYGERITVEYICDSYVKFGKHADWPKDDSVPMIIGAYNPLTKTRFVCSPNFLIPLNPDGTIPKDE